MVLFEDLVPHLTSLLGKSFAFDFVDPTGWTGLSLKKLRPLVANRNAELLINFMYDYVNRFLELENVRESIDDFFGGPVEGIGVGAGREESILELYRRRLKAQGAHVLATSTRIKKPLESRAYFHLVYVTHHVKGLVEFKNVVEKLAPEELDAWAKVQDARDAIKGQQSLFRGLANAQPPKDPRSPTLKTRVDRTCDQLINSYRSSFKTWRDVQELLLQHPDVWNSDVEEATRRALDRGDLAIPELASRRAKLKPKYKVRLP